MVPTWSQISSKLPQNMSQIGSKLPQFCPCWLQGGFLWKNLVRGTCPRPQVSIKKSACSSHVGPMLIPCWFHVGSMLAPCWLMLDQVASKMAQDAIMLIQVGLKMANMASKSKFWSIFAHVGTPWTFNILRKALVLKVRLHFALFCFSYWFLSL